MATGHEFAASEKRCRATPNLTNETGSQRFEPGRASDHRRRRGPEGAIPVPLTKKYLPLPNRAYSSM